VTTGASAGAVVAGAVTTGASAGAVVAGAVTTGASAGAVVAGAVTIFGDVTTEGVVPAIAADFTSTGIIVAV